MIQMHPYVQCLLFEALADMKASLCPWALASALRFYATADTRATFMPNALKLQQIHGNYFPVH
jgi:hypothetical protein